MATERKDDGVAYVRKADAENRRYVQDLLTENERQRLRLVWLETEHLHLTERIQLTDHLLTEHEAMRTVVEDLTRQKLALMDDLRNLRAEAGYREDDRTQLRERLAAIETESRRFSEEYVEVEKRNNNLLNLYVASYRLHGTVERSEVLEAIRDIVANIVGCEEQALFELDGSRLRLVDSVGVDPEPLRELPLGDGRIGAAALAGDIYVARPEDEAGDLTACIPLKLGGNVTGVIALFRMLPQKPALAEADQDLMDLLATHAATALYCTRLHQEHGAAVAP